jgi:uncharacterized protein with ParB-like and HNH nuclease domain
MILASDVTILGIVKEIKNGNILLPMIQRPFVWHEDKITTLFDSILRRYPIGIVLLYEVPDNLNNIIYGRRFFDKIEENMKYEQYDVEVKSGQILVLDGQQRLQSLYLGVMGGTFMGKHLYYNIFFFDKENDPTDISFKFFSSSNFAYYDEKEQDLYIRFDKVIDLTEKIIENSHNNTIILEEIKRNCGDISFLKNDDFLKILQNIYRDILPSVFFHPNANVFKYQLIQKKDFNDELLEIFVRFNQGGITLSKSDLIFSTLKLQWHEIGKLLEELEDRTGINRDLLLKALIVVSDLPANSKLSEIKRHIDTIKNNYEKFKEVIEQFHDRLRRLTEETSRIYRKFNFIIPVIYYFFKNSSKLTVSELVMIPGLVEYILIIVYNSNLRSDSSLNEIIKIIKEDQSSYFPIEKIKDYLKRKQQKITIDSESLNADPILTFSLIQRNNWKPLFSNNKLHIDHIFPKSRANELPDELRPLVDSIFNKYVVFSGDNITKSDKLPEEYFTGEREKLIDLYLLPKEYLRKETFKEMIEWRKNKIKEFFKKYLNLEIDVSTK